MKFKQPKNITTAINTLWIEKILPIMREKFFDERIMASPTLNYLSDFFKFFIKLGNIKYFRENLPQFDPKKTNVSWIPINKPIEGADQIALPEDILDLFIEKAKHRVIINFCGCRTLKTCKNYHSDIGCLMMGESALLIPEKSRREVDVDTAKAHVRKAIEAGLIPITGKARLDNDIFMIPDRGKLLSVCFCCECCCITRFTRYASPELINKFHHPIEGLTIKISDDCIGCGKCISKCYINAIEIIDGKASIGQMCRVCGRCALYCPQRAIKLKLDNSNVVNDVFKRIERYVDF